MVSNDKFLLFATSLKLIIKLIILFYHDLSELFCRSLQHDSNPNNLLNYLVLSKLMASFS